VSELGKTPKLSKQLEDFEEEERAAYEKVRDQRLGDVDFTEVVPEPVLEKEFYGGFRKADGCDYEPTKAELEARPKFTKFLYVLRIEQRGFPSHWRASPKGWATEAPQGLVDGVMPETHDWLKRRKRWPAWRDSSWVAGCSIRFYAPSEVRDWQGVKERWPQAVRGESSRKGLHKIGIAGRHYSVTIGAAPPLDKEAHPPRTSERVTSNQPPNFPFALRAILESEQKRPTVTPTYDSDEACEARELREALPKAPTDPNRGPSTGFAYGVRREEYNAFRTSDSEGGDEEIDLDSEHDDSERRAGQWGRPTCWYSGERWTEDWKSPPKYRPSEQLEAERFKDVALPRLKKQKLLPNEYIYGGPRKELGTSKRWSAKVGLPEKVGKLGRAPKIWRRGKYRPVAEGVSKDAWDEQQRAWKRCGAPKTEWPAIQGKPPQWFSPFAVKWKPARDVLRAELDRPVAEFFAKGGTITYCPAETTSRMMAKANAKARWPIRVIKEGRTIWITAAPLVKQRRQNKFGRPRAYDELPMTAAQRKALSRATQVKTRAPNTRPRPDAADGHALRRSASGLVTRRSRRKTMNRELSSRVTRSADGMIHVVGFPTPKGSKPLIGELTITAKPLRTQAPVAEAAHQPIDRQRHSGTPTQTVLDLVSRLPVELRLLLLSLPLPDPPAEFALAAE